MARTTSSSMSIKQLTFIYSEISFRLIIVTVDNYCLKNDTDENKPNKKINKNSFQISYQIEAFSNPEVCQYEVILVFG